MSNKRKCPNCNGTNHAKIIYGLIADMRKAEELIKKGKIVRGGCTIDDLEWKCNDCRTRW